MKVKVTSDAKKLWSCANMAIGERENRGKLPTSAGQEFSIKLPGLRSDYCDGLKWPVATKPKDGKDSRNGVSVCEHQIDFLSPEDEKLARQNI